MTLILSVGLVSLLPDFVCAMIILTEENLFL